MRPHLAQAGVAEVVVAVDDLLDSLLPRDCFPLAGATRPDTFHRFADAVAVEGCLDTRLSFQADATAGQRPAVGVDIAGARQIAHGDILWVAVVWHLPERLGGKERVGVAR